MLVTTHTFAGMGEGYEPGMEEGAKLAMGPCAVAEPRGRSARHHSSFSEGSAAAQRAAEPTCRDDTDSIESLGDKMLSPQVKEVVGGTPRVTVHHHHAEEKSGSQPVSPSEVSLIGAQPLPVFEL